MSIENQTGMLSSRLWKNRDGKTVSRELIETYKSYDLIPCGAFAHSGACSPMYYLSIVA